MIDAETFAALYRAHAGELLGFLRRRGAADAAPDLLAETFLVAWRRRGALPDEGRRRACLFGTARRLLLAQNRADAARPRPLPPDLEPPPLRTDDQPRDREAAVHAALDALPTTDRDLLTLTIWEGLSVVEAAEVVGLSAGAARTRLHRARNKLAGDHRLVGLLADKPLG